MNADEIEFFDINFIRVGIHFFLALTVENCLKGRPLHLPFSNGEKAKAMYKIQTDSNFYPVHKE